MTRNKNKKPWTRITRNTTTALGTVLYVCLISGSFFLFSTGMPIEVRTAHSKELNQIAPKVTYCKLDIDIRKNQPKIIRKYQGKSTALVLWCILFIHNPCCLLTPFFSCSCTVLHHRPSPPSFTTVLHHRPSPPFFARRTHVHGQHTHHGSTRGRTTTIHKWPHGLFGQRCRPTHGALGRDGNHRHHRRQLEITQQLHQTIFFGVGRDHALRRIVIDVFGQSNGCPDP